METLNEYARKLADALQNNKAYTVFNRDAVHASIVVHLAFLHAKEEILLLSNKLDPMIYASAWLIDAVEGFIGRGGKLRVLVETDIREGPPASQNRPRSIPTTSLYGVCQKRLLTVTNSISWSLTNGGIGSSAIVESSALWWRSMSWTKAIPN